MAQFIPSVEQIELPHIEQWGASLGFPKLAVEMLQNPRLKQRVQQQTLLKHNCDLDADFSESDVLLLETLGAQQERMRELCGLVINGAFIRQQISGPQFSTLVKKFDLNDLKIAVKLRDLHPSNKVFEVEMARLNELVRHSGNACLELWREGLTKQMQIRVDMMFRPKIEKESATHLKIGIDHASAIVGSVSQMMADQN